MSEIKIDKRLRRGPENPGFKSHCKYGHPLEGENLITVKSTGQRMCLTCKRVNAATFRDRRAKKRREENEC